MYQAHARELLNQKDAGADSREEEGFGLLDMASERLQEALLRLENNINHAIRAGNGAQDTEAARFFEQENETLKQEREALNATISELRGQYGDLHKAASTIYNKLNDSIKRLTQIIGD